MPLCAAPSRDCVMSTMNTTPPTSHTGIVESW